MKRNNWPVEQYGVSPAGKPDECFYCGEKVGSIHKPECVIRNRTVVLKVEIEIVMDVPEFWDEEDINFHYNESSWCASNLDIPLSRMEQHDECLCNYTKINYVREATKEDEDKHGLWVDKLPS